MAGIGVALPSLAIGSQGLDWTPAQLGAALVAWYRADLGVTLDAGAVVQWDDQSGGGYHATQAAAAKQPSYVSSDAQFSGRPALSFVLGETLEIAGPALASGVTIAAAVRDLGGEAFAIICGVGKDGAFALHRYELRRAGGTQNPQFSAISLGTGVAASATGTTVVNADAHVLLATHAGSDGRLYVDGAEEASLVGAVAPPGASDWFIGSRLDAGLYGTFSLAELVICDGAIAAANRAALARYMGARYGITVS